MTTVKKRTRVEIVRENEFLHRQLILVRKQKLADGLVGIIKTVTIAAVFIYFFYTLQIIASSFAGKTTNAEIQIHDLRYLFDWIPVIFGGGGVGYGLLQRQLRRATVQQMHGRLRSHELEADPGRSSSNLTDRGDTNPEDKE